MKHGPFGPGGLVTLICYTSIKIFRVGKFRPTASYGLPKIQSSGPKQDP